MLTADGTGIDGSWDLDVFVTDLNETKKVRTRGDVHIGGLMLKLVNMFELDSTRDWSDHAMWWPENNVWLLRTRRTLDQYEVHGGTVVHFTPMHKNVHVVLPDLQTRDHRLNFSANIFNNIIALCKALSIRHPEELSLMRTTERKSQRRSVNVQATPHRTSSFKAADLSHTHHNGGGLQREPQTAGSADVLIGRSMDNLLFDANDSTVVCKTASLDSLTSLTSLTASPSVSAGQAVKVLSRPQNYTDKTKIHARWLDSSLSLLEQGVEENDTILLRYKFAAFFDLNVKYDAVRINQIYEQAKWSLICEHVSCSDEEMLFFAGLQLHIQRQQQSSDVQLFYSGPGDGAEDQNDNDDIGAALDNLQMSLSGNESKSTVNSSCPTLCHYHLFLKPKKFGLKHYKLRYFVLRDGNLTMFRSAEDEKTDNQQLFIILRGCDVRGEARVNERKFVIKLTSLTDDTSTEYWLRLDDADKYANWLAALRLSTRRRTVTADASYDSEVQAVRDVLRLRETSAAATDASDISDSVNPEDFVSGTVLRKLGRRKVLQFIKDACRSVQAMPLYDAKLTFIRTWQNLPECGYAYFMVSFKGCKKKDLIGIGVQRLAQMETSSGRCLKAWTYDVMTSWSVNWNIEQVKIEIAGADENSGTEVAFQCLSANCKVVHEYIGGYVFLAMRSLDKNQTLNEELFQKLTGGWI